MHTTVHFLCPNQLCGLSTILPLAWNTNYFITLLSAVMHLYMWCDIHKLFHSSAHKRHISDLLIIENCLTRNFDHRCKNVWVGHSEKKAPHQAI